MKPVLLVILFWACLPGGVQKTAAQNTRLYASPRGAEVLDKNNDTLLNPWCGGWVNPQFSNIDMNGDGRQDLFVFEPGYGDNRILTFLNIGNGQYQYYPEYESFFPHLQYWAILVDYNNDGKADIFTYAVAAGGGGIDVWENVSDNTGLKFKRVTYDPDFLKDLLCYSSNGKDTLNIYATSNGIPIVKDIDGDGDIDIVSFDPNQATAFYYRNMAVEKGLDINDIHFNFTNPTHCWGKFETTNSADTPAYLHIGCGREMKHGHGGTSILAVDVDNDGDLDMLLGNLYQTQLAQLTNGRIVNKAIKSQIDTFISSDSGIVGNKQKVDLNYYPAAYMADADGDNVADIIVAPMNPATGHHKTWVYRNTGAKTGVQYSFFLDNFLQSSMLDEGEHAAPAFVDYNNDGLMDLVIATRANANGGYSYDHLELYKNIGTIKKAVYKKVDDDFASMSRLKLAYLSPSFGDIDGDGRSDMLIGRADGRVMFFKNLADSGGSLQMKLVGSPYQNIRVGGYSTPCLAHISSDTLYDVVVGRDSGAFAYFQNTGTRKSPVFKKITDSFGKVRTNLYYYGNYKYDHSGNIIDSSILKQPIGRSAPLIADIDHDGKPDMVSGSYYGEMFFWFDIKANINAKFARTDTVFYNTISKKKENKFLGHYTMPAAADIDNDQVPDMLIGNNMGGILYYGSQKVKLGIDEQLPPVPFSDAEFNVYPNPAHQSVNISFNDNRTRSGRLSFINILGEECYQKAISPADHPGAIDISMLSPGIYFVKLQDNTGRIGVRKLVLR